MLVKTADSFGSIPAVRRLTLSFMIMQIAALTSQRKLRTHMLSTSYLGHLAKTTFSF